MYRLEGVLEIQEIRYGKKKKKGLLIMKVKKNFITYVVYIVRGRVSLFRKNMFVMSYVV